MKQYRTDFPILAQKVHGQPLVYLDSSGSSQKPQCVIDAITHYYQNNHANVHRALYELSLRATDAYETARHQVQQFIRAKETHEIIFTKGTTESINLVAETFARAFLQPNDEVIISEMEHHSNIVPWQQLKERFGIQLKIIPVKDEGDLDLQVLQQLFSKRTKLLAVTHASNVLGTINPLKKIIQMAHAEKVPVLVDGAQAFPHRAIDVVDLDCDFYTFSAHKAYGPTGVGVLYGKAALLEQLPPYQSGGAMIEQVSFEKTTFSPLPFRLEAGTPAIASVVGFAAALTYLETIGMEKIVKHENALLHYATAALSKMPGLKILGEPAEKCGVIAFVMEAIHPHDIATILDQSGIAVRAGHHCAMPLMKRFRIPACVRVSFGLYNSEADVDALVRGLQVVREMLEPVA